MFLWIWFMSGVFCEFHDWLFNVPLMWAHFFSIKVYTLLSITRSHPSKMRNKYNPIFTSILVIFTVRSLIYEKKNEINYAPSLPINQFNVPTKQKNNNKKKITWLLTQK